MRCGVSFEKIYINICLFLGHKLSCWGLDSFSHPQNFCRCLSLHSPSPNPLCNNICIFFVVQLKSGSNKGGNVEARDLRQGNQEPASPSFDLPKQRFTGPHQRPRGRVAEVLVEQVKTAHNTNLFDTRAVQRRGTCPVFSFTDFLKDLTLRLL